MSGSFSITVPEKQTVSSPQQTSPSPPSHNLALLDFNRQARGMQPDAPEMKKWSCVDHGVLRLTSLAMPEPYEVRDVKAGFLADLPCVPFSVQTAT
jgi:hypothetical protein